MKLEGHVSSPDRRGRTALRRLSAVILFGSLLAFPLGCQTLKAVYYHPADFGMLAHLADDCVSPNTCNPPTPRTQAIKDIYSHFQYIATDLGANAVIIRMPEEGWSFIGDIGSGAAYDPSSPTGGKPQVAVGQEIILDIANHFGLKVFFTIEPSQYHEYVNAADSGGAPNSFGYMESIIDPAAFYGTPCTTELQTVELSNTCVTSYYNDPRVGGFIFLPETFLDLEHEAGNSVITNYILQYWPTFYNLVHWNGSTTAKAAIYVAGGLDNPTVQLADIDLLKTLFKNNTGLAKPDLFGVEWYGGAALNYNLSHASADMATALHEAINDEYTIPPSQVWMAEGGTDTTSGGYLQYLNEFYSQAIYQGMNQGLGMVSVWAGDTWATSCPDSHGSVDYDFSTYTCPTGGEGGPGSGSATFDLFTSTYVPLGSRTYNLPIGGWWGLLTAPSTPSGYFESASYTSENNVSPNHFPLEYGSFTYSSVSPRGYWTAEAFADGGATYFYASPNPMQPNSSNLGTTTLYFATTASNFVEVHVDSPTGNLLCTYVPPGSCSTAAWVENGMVFYLTTRGGAQTLAKAYASCTGSCIQDPN